MPELPEVETTMRLVRPDLLGRRIRSTRVDWLRTLGGSSRAQFERDVVGATIAKVRRRAKYIRLDLTRVGRPAGTILIHLRMSGRLLISGTRSKPGAYVRVALGLAGGGRLDFVDVRKFGRFAFHPDGDAALSHLGPEPLGPDFSADWLWTSLRARRRLLKPLLLDQQFVAGLGNIYVDEALFRARLHPERRSHTLKRGQSDALHTAIVEVLSDAISKEGSSFDTFYRTPEGQPGAYQDEFQVYGRHGKPCRRCGAMLKRLVVGQRGTHVCLRCQRPPRARN